MGDLSTLAAATGHTYWASVAYSTGGFHPMSILTTTRGKIDQVRMLGLMQDKVSKSEMARIFGCSVSAVRDMARKLKAQNSLGEVKPGLSSSGALDVMEQLKHMNRTILEELHRCRRFIDKEDRELREYEDLEKKCKARPQDVLLKNLMEKKGVVTYSKIMQLQNNVISIAGEIRKQLEMQLKIAEAMYSVSMVAEFQEAVIQILKDADEKFGSSLKDEVIAKLRERKSIRGLLKQVEYKKVT
jgi:hypothetical protein